MLEGIKGSDYGLMVQPVNRNSPTIADEIKNFLERHRPYGVLLLPPISDNDELAELCASYGTRYVRMASIELDAPEHIVTSNDRAAVEEAVTYLIEEGHENIALIEGPKGFISAAERRAGYEQAMAKAKLPVTKDMITPGAYTFESGYEAGVSILDADKKPTAIFVANDEMAIGVMIAARERNINIPDDLSIIGFDDTPLSSHVWPPLTTVRWPINAMAKSAAERLIAEKQNVPSKDVFLSSALIKRGSVAKIIKV
jgi:LacI family transcriptional regulator